jgi:hypothetical protein
MATNQRAQSSDFPHASASRPEARERSNAVDDIRAEPSTGGQDLRIPLRQALDQMDDVDIVAVYQTLLDDLHPDYARWLIEGAKMDARRNEQSLQAEQAMRAMQSRRRYQVEQNRTANEAKSNQTPTAKDYHRVQGVIKDDKGGAFVSEMTWGRIPRNEQGQTQNDLNAEDRAKDVSDVPAKKESKKSAKKPSKESGTNMVPENFTNLPHEAQVKALDKVTSELCSIARHISDASAADDSKRLKELTAQVRTLTARKKFMESHVKPKDSRDEKQQPEKDNRNAPAKKAPDVKVVQTNFRDVPYGEQIKLLKRAEMDLSVIAEQMTQPRKKGQFDEWEELYPQFLALTQLQKFRKTHLKTKDPRYEGSHTHKSDGDAAAKKVPDIKVVGANFRDLRADDQTKALRHAYMDMRVIKWQMAQVRQRGQFQILEDLNGQFVTLKERTKLMEAHLKDLRRRIPQMDENDDGLTPSWLGKEEYEDWTTAWLEMKSSKIVNAGTPQAKNKNESKDVKKEAQNPCSCSGKCQILLRHPRNPNPEELTELEQKENARERWVAETLSELAEDISQMLIQTPRLTKKHGFEVPDQRLQRTLEYIVTLSKGKSKGTPPPDSRAHGRGAVLSFEDELIDKLRTYSALLWDNQESFEVDKRLLANAKRTLEWIEKLRLNSHEGPEDTEKIGAMKNWQWSKGEAPPARASAAPAKTSTRAKPAGH